VHVKASHLTHDTFGGESNVSGLTETETETETDKFAKAAL